MVKDIKYKRIHGLITLLEVILVVMISGWYYYSERKMGMIRHIMAKNVYKFPNYFTDTNIINSSSVCDYDFNTVFFSNKI